MRNTARRPQNGLARGVATIPHLATKRRLAGTVWLTPRYSCASVAAAADATESLPPHKESDGR